jgi:hypothetical protein
MKQYKKKNNNLQNITQKTNDRVTQEKGVRVMMFNATFNNISVISWRLVLLVEETGVPGENQRPSARH